MARRGGRDMARRVGLVRNWCVLSWRLVAGGGLPLGRQGSSDVRGRVQGWRVGERPGSSPRCVSEGNVGAAWGAVGCNVQVSRSGDGTASRSGEGTAGRAGGPPGRDGSTCRGGAGERAETLRDGWSGLFRAGQDRGTAGRLGRAGRGWASRAGAGPDVGRLVGVGRAVQDGAGGGPGPDSRQGWGRCGVSGAAWVGTARLVGRVTACVRIGRVCRPGAMRRGTDRRRGEAGGEVRGGVSGTDRSGQARRGRPGRRWHGRGSRAGPGEGRSGLSMPGVDGEGWVRFVATVRDGGGSSPRSGKGRWVGSCGDGWVGPVGGSGSARRGLSAGPVRGGLSGGAGVPGVGRDCRGADRTGAGWSTRACGGRAGLVGRVRDGSDVSAGSVRLGPSMWVDVGGLRRGLERLVGRWGRARRAVGSRVGGVVARRRTVVVGRPGGARNGPSTAGTGG